VVVEGYIIENFLTSKVKQFHWYDVSKLPSDGSVALLGLRDESKYAAGHIEGFNIALIALRENLGKLISKEPVYITCDIGLRCDLASRNMGKTALRLTTSVADLVSIQL
jgi:rhodanese-related sulfurtransferase